MGFGGRHRHCTHLKKICGSLEPCLDATTYAENVILISLSNGGTWQCGRELNKSARYRPRKENLRAHKPGAGTHRETQRNQFATNGCARPRLIIPEETQAISTTNRSCNFCSLSSRAGRSASTSAAASFALTPTFNLLLRRFSST
jgi:hypothetical protein